MRIIYNAKLRVKLLVSFFILIAAMILIGVIGIMAMGSINASNTEIYENNYKSTSAMQTVNNNLSDMRRNVLCMTIEKYSADIASYEQKVYDSDAHNKTNMDFYKSMIIAQEEMDLYTEFEKNMNNYTTERNKTMDLAKQGLYDEAEAQNTNVALPLANSTQASIDALIAFNEKFAQDNVNLASELYISSIYQTVIIVVVAIIIAIALGLFISSLITTPLNAVRDVAEKIADGDLTVDIPARYIRQKDEIGKLANNIEDMKQGLITTVSGIKDSTHSLGQQVDSTNQTLGILNDRITDTSAATEELSASMEETGASAEEMNATASEIERAVETVAEKAEEGATKSGEIHERASSLGKNVNASIEKSNNVFNEIKVSLEKALEDSKAVDEINALADAILGITSQTTLLALNASIEAARAGEAGRGFAVVANEISALADNSKNTVTQIQAITKVVMAAVNALANSSTNLLNFVAEDVMNDYKDMLSTADSYTTDAVYVNDLTSDLSATSEELLASVQVLMRAINEVSMAAQEGARTTTVVAEQTSDISTNASTIVKNMAETQDTSNTLVTLVDKFKLAE